MKAGLQAANDKSPIDAIRKIDVEYKEPSLAKEVISRKLDPEIARVAV